MTTGYKIRKFLENSGKMAIPISRSSTVKKLPQNQYNIFLQFSEPVNFWAGTGILKPFQPGWYCVEFILKIPKVLISGSILSCIFQIIQ